MPCEVELLSERRLAEGAREGSRPLLRTPELSATASMGNADPAELVGAAHRPWIPEHFPEGPTRGLSI